MNNVLKTVAINIMVLFTMLGFISYSIPFFYSIKVGLGPFLKQDSISKKLKLPNYEGIVWAKQYYIEDARLSKSTYFDYIGWRRNPFKGETINIDTDGLRKTVNTIPDGRKVFFFGGSTMWGSGVNDSNTIPSLFSDIHNVAAVNYGETGWTAHQSLNMLQKLYIQGLRPDVVVFYDGVNEVNGKCRKENTFFSSSRETSFRKNMISDNVYSYQYLLEPVIRSLREPVQNATKPVARFMQQETETRSTYDCDSDHKKAELIAESLYFDWLTAKQLVESHGGKFYAVLQPVAFLGHPKLSHLPNVMKDKDNSRQYQTVYALFLEKLNSNNFPFHDFTSIFNRDEYIYIDHCHVTPNGNKLIAQQLASLLMPAVETVEE